MITVNYLTEVISDICSLIIILFVGYWWCLVIYDWLAGKSQSKSYNEALRELAYLQIKHENGEHDVIFDRTEKTEKSPEIKSRYGGLDYLESATASWCPVCGGKMEGGPGGNRRHFCPSCGQMFDSNGNAVN